MVPGTEAASKCGLIKKDTYKIFDPLNVRFFFLNEDIKQERLHMFDVPHSVKELGIRPIKCYFALSNAREITAQKC